MWFMTLAREFGDQKAAKLLEDYGNTVQDAGLSTRYVEAATIEAKTMMDAGKINLLEAANIILSEDYAECQRVLKDPSQRDVPPVERFRSLCADPIKAAEAIKAKIKAAQAIENYYASTLRHDESLLKRARTLAEEIRRRGP